MSAEDPTKLATDALGKVVGEAYSDLVRPGAQQVGGAIGTIFKVGLSPIALLDWGFESSKVWLKEVIEKRIAQIPEDCRVPPPAHIAIEAITRISAAADVPEIRDLYAELLMKAMDSRTAKRVHPAFIGLVSQLTPQEALVFLSLRKFEKSTIFSENASSRASPTIESQFLKHCESLGLPEAKEQAPIWLENLRRLRLLDLSHYSDLDFRFHNVERPSASLIDSRYLELTDTGQALISMCAPLSNAGEA
jgi:hypothetical protein